MIETICMLTQFSKQKETNMCVKKTKNTINETCLFRT